MQKRSVTQLFVACAILTLASLALAKNVMVSIPIGEVDVHSGDRGNFYVVSVSIPADVSGNRLDHVFIEFAVDATPTSLEDSVATPEFGVFPLTQPYAGGGMGGAPGRDALPTIETTVPSVRPVATGENRLVRMDITKIVEGWIANPSSNHGLVIGSLTGPEVGTVTLRSELPGTDGAIRVVFLYQNRFGDRISERE